MSLAFSFCVQEMPLGLHLHRVFHLIADAIWPLNPSTISLEAVTVSFVCAHILYK